MHFAAPLPDGKHVLICDAGTDQIARYPLVGAQELAPQPDLVLSAPPGTLPRHLAISPDGKRLFAVCELGNIVLGWSLAGSEPAYLGKVSTLPEDCAMASASSAIRCHPNGRFLYSANRGHDSIAVFDITGADGLPRLIGTCPSGGKTPRELCLSVAGDVMVVANQDSHTLAAFTVDPLSGLLAPLGQGMQIGSPVCVLFTE